MIHRICFWIRVYNVHWPAIVAHAIVPDILLSIFKRRLVPASFINLIWMFTNQYFGLENGKRSVVSLVNIASAAAVVGVDCKVVTRSISAIIGKPHIESFFAISDELWFYLSETMPQGELSWLLPQLLPQQNGLILKFGPKESILYSLDSLDLRIRHCLLEFRLYWLELLLLVVQLKSFHNKLLIDHSESFLKLNWIILFLQFDDQFIDDISSLSEVPSWHFDCLARQVEI